MLGKAFENMVGSRNSRILRRKQVYVDRINALSNEVGALSDAELLERSVQLQERSHDVKSVDELLVEAFALVREAGERANGTRHFDVQLLGGIALAEGNIAEMRTGEGKTLVATLPAYLMALNGRGVHVVTVNDYLARRDAEWMAPIFRTLGMSVGVVQSHQPFDEKIEAYQADVTYGTNNEFGFDYLRDNMAPRLEDRVQRALNYAIVDEVDSILIDEARTPLIIAGAASENTDIYRIINKIAPTLRRQDKVESATPAILGGEREEDTGDFFVDEENRQVELTELGHHTVESRLKSVGLLQADESLYSSTNIGLVHHVTAALKAHFLHKRDVDYMIQDGQVVIIDEHTGRAMHGRRWSDGMHQSVEAKEGLAIRQESQTVASTTFQNYFRLYERLCGMTGTAETEAFEFKQIYSLEVIVIPTHMPMIRDDRNDLIFMSLDEKYDAIVEDINDCRLRGQPVLVGTTSIESSERLSGELNRRKITHSVLNAKQHEREADIVAQAGVPSTVTIATNMAGRGTDIVLGGSWQAEIQNLGDSVTDEQVEQIKEKWEQRHKRVLEAGGLHIIGTERHESRRIDNQLRGRSGRQGDPGSSRFYLSIEDDLLRLFAGPRMRGMFESMRLEKGEALEAKMVTNAIEKAQRKIEGRNYDIRKSLLEYDDVANDQRQIIYQQRNELLSEDDLLDMVSEMRETVVTDLIAGYVPPQSIPDQWDLGGLEQLLPAEYGVHVPLRDLVEKGEIENEDQLRSQIIDDVSAAYTAKRRRWFEMGKDASAIEKFVTLSILDRKWTEHLTAMELLRQGIHLRAYAQKQPKQEYKRESFELFQDMLYQIQETVTTTLCRFEIDIRTQSAEEEELRRRRDAMRKMRFLHENGSATENAKKADDTKQSQPFKRENRKIGRNEPCPCGSGKKFKQCHGRQQAADQPPR